MSFDKSDLEDEIFSLYFGNHPDDCNCQLHQIPVFTLAAENRTTVINRAISDIRKQDSAAINKDLFDVYANNYFKGINSVFSDITPDIERSRSKDIERSRNGVMWQKLQQYKLNAASFAAHKSYMVTDKIKAAKDNAEVKAIVNKFNRYQAAEYNTIVARSRTAKQWETFQQEKHLFPNLTWIRSRSANPRELHLGYVGIVLPINDPFWNANQPGNLWNCKCDWKTTDAQPTAEPTKITPPATGLDGNPYETGELITNKHPYFKNAPEWVKRNSMLLAPDEIVYSELKAGKGILKSHILAEAEQEYAENRLIAIELLKNGYNEVKLLPQIQESETELRIKYYGIDYCNKFKDKCPDAYADNDLLEFKSSNFRNLSTRILSGSKQANIIVLKPDVLLTKEYINRFTDGQFEMKDRLNIKTIIIVNKDGKTHTFNRINKGESL